MIFLTSFYQNYIAQSRIFFLLRSLLVICLLIAMGRLVGDLMDKWVTGRRTSGIDLSLARQPSAPPLGTALATTVIPALFGTAIPGAAMAPSPADSSRPPQTAAGLAGQLTLKGIIGAQDRGAALAILNVKGGGGEDGVFAVGDLLPGGAILRSVRFDRVVVALDDVEATLYLDEASDGSLPAVVPDQEPVLAAEALDNRWEIQRDFFYDKLADLTALGQEVNVQAYMENAQQKGYRLSATAEGGLLAQFGLRAGDIVTEVNGIKLNTIRQGMKAFNGIKNSDTIRIAVTREGVEKNFVYTLN